MQNYKSFNILLIFIIICSRFFGESWQNTLIEKIEKKEFPSWMLEQIAEDLQPFAKTGITKEMLDSLESYDADRGCLLVRYEISNGKLSARCHESTKAQKYPVLFKAFENLLKC